VSLLDAAGVPDVKPLDCAGRAPILLVLASLAAGPVAAQRPADLSPGILRVCADPDNLPFSNSAGEGLENKLAELLATTWDAKLEYIWWAAPRGLMRMLNGKYCDVLLQAPTEYDMAGVTRPYYRTSYVIVQRKDAPHQVVGLDDPALKTMKIGVHLFSADGENTPPAMALSAHGVVGNLIGFSTTYMGGQNHPYDIIKAVISDSIDVAIVWGPIAGYYTKQLGADLALTPVANDTLTGIPFAFSMGLATRRRERAFRDSLQKFLDLKAPEIHTLLEGYGIPLLPLVSDTAAGAPPSGSAR
jgi:mxaJ protein